MKNIVCCAFVHLENAHQEVNYRTFCVNMKLILVGECDSRVSNRNKACENKWEAQ